MRSTFAGERVLRSRRKGLQFRLAATGMDSTLPAKGCFGLGVKASNPGLAATGMRSTLPAKGCFGLGVKSFEVPASPLRA